MNLGLLGNTALIFVLILIFYLFRTQIAFENQALSLLIFRSKKPGAWLYTLFFLPGTMVHELSHWLMAELLRVRTGEINILPNFDEEDQEGSKLGSVMTARTDPIRAFLIGIAPLLVGTIILIILAALLSNILANDYVWWQLALIFYGIFVMANSMLASPSDLRYWPLFVIIVVALALAVRTTGIQLAPSLIFQLGQILSTTVYALLLALGINFVTLLVTFAFRRIIEGVTGNRVVRSR